MSMNEVEEYLSDIVKEASKEVLRSPHLRLFHYYPAELLMFLHCHFKKLADQQRSIDSIAITEDSAKIVLGELLSKHLQVVGGASSGKLPQFDGELDPEQFYSTKGAPVMAQRTLREFLQQHRVNITAFAEVVEICRFLDQHQKDRFCAPSPPFGSVNMIHFASVFITLYPTRTLFDLICLLFDNLDGHPLGDKTKLQIIYSWAVIDASNRESLGMLCDTIISHPSLTLPLLLELCPDAKNIATVTAVGGRGDGGVSQGGAVVVHDEGATAGEEVEEGHEFPDPPLAVLHSSEEREEEANFTIPRDPEDEAFWAAFR